MFKVRVFVPPILLATVMSSSCFASTVCDESYGYQYGDTIRAVTSDAFVVTEGCPAEELHKLPKPFVAIRMMHGPMDTEAAPEQVAIGEEADVTDDELLGTVRFGFNSDDLSASEKLRLNSLISRMPAGGELTVTGYTCSIGTKGYNLGLSRRRAKAVARYLKAQHVRVTHVEAKGECCPISTKVKKLNRRVEIKKEGRK